MSVIVGSARTDENGGISDGAAGDQTGYETSTQEWYLHSKGWTLLRAKDAEAREKIAANMEAICRNPLIGYDQSQNDSLYYAVKPFGFDASKVDTACECDCAKAVRVCVLFAGIDCWDFSTGTEVSALEATGAFEVHTEEKYTSSCAELLRGDILVTQTKGHTVVVLTDGENVNEAEEETTEPAGPEASSGTEAAPEPPAVPAPSSGSARTAGLYAEFSNRALAGEYVVTTDLYLRAGAGRTQAVLTVMKEGSIVRNYGFYSLAGDTRWLYVQYGERVGFCSGKFLRRT